MLDCTMADEGDRATTWTIRDERRTESRILRPKRPVRYLHIHSQQQVGAFDPVSECRQLALYPVVDDAFTQSLILSRGISICKPTLAFRVLAEFPTPSLQFLIQQAEVAFAYLHRNVSTAAHPCSTSQTTNDRNPTST